MGQFASAEGKGVDQFHTPRSIVNLYTEMIEPYKGRIYHSCCGYGEIFVQSEKFVEFHSGKLKIFQFMIRNQMIQLDAYVRFILQFEEFILHSNVFE